MDEPKHQADAPFSVPRVAAGQDRFGEQRGLGVSTLAFKLSAQDSTGIFVVENTFHDPTHINRVLLYANAVDSRPPQTTVKSSGSQYGSKWSCTSSR
ncbi:MAG: hypothetical protein ACOCXI_07810 [Chloroflexota bacterium]